MSEYKCICCGMIKEGTKQCSCSNCGYLMFEGNYQRSEKLKEEILSFVSKLRMGEKDGFDLEYFREENPQNKNSKIIFKRNDDERFPTLNTIQKFVRSAAKTEIFYQRSIDTVNAVKNYVSTYYTQNYQLSYDKIFAKVQVYDELLKRALSALGLDLELPSVQLPETTVTYEEIPEELLLPIVHEIADALIALCEKIKQFIKLNNLYGDAFKRGYDSDKVLLEKEPAEELQKTLQNVKSIVAKKYAVDIFEDGTKELEEMLSAYWKAIKVLLAVPILKKRYTYAFEDGDVFSDHAIFEVLSGIFNDIYYPLYDLLYIDGPLKDKDEKELFDIYNEMIELDTLNIMGINKEHLLRIGAHEEKLNNLIGLGAIKDSVKKLKAFVVNKKDNEQLNLHMCFYGNPGTGKTEVARIIAGILHENKILPTDNVIEVSRKDLISEYVGETSQKTSCAIEQALGGVLFVDEAYSLIPKDGGFDYGHEAVATLIKAMEDYRGKFCVILAGYRNEMLHMLESNPGFKSRIQFELDFPNYSREELAKILDLMLANRGYIMSAPTRNRILDITDIKRKDPNFANARDVRNILDQVIMCQNLRALDSDDKEVGIVDVEKYIKDAKISLPLAIEGTLRKILTADEELDELVGLDSVKRMVRKIRAYAKRNKDLANFNVHMCFYGNPGTGKTEVARIISRILYDAGVLEEAKMIETDAHGLIGRFVGETAPKTEAKIQDAMGGVLFIDEAYSLTDASSNGNSGTSYGDEAIAVLLKRMEDARGRFCVVLAGYRDQMQRMISSNPGLESRIQFALDFPDYTKEELFEIALRFAQKKGYRFERDALDRFTELIEYYRNKPNFANARTVRNVLEQVILNQNLRTEDDETDNKIILQDVEDYVSDENILQKHSNDRKIGFY